MPSLEYVYLICIVISFMYPCGVIDRKLTIKSLKVKLKITMKKDFFIRYKVIETPYNNELIHA